MKQIDEAKCSYDSFIKEYEQYASIDMSESDTRSKVIDKLLLDVLGWSESDILREGHVDSGYYDYQISLPGLYFIVEAKRQFKDLTIPTKHKKASVNSLYKENKDVIDQIRSYAIDSGIPYGIITNGKQFIFIKAFNTDGKPWKNNQCLLFNGFEDIEDRFIEFYDNLSKYSIISNGGFKYDLQVDSFEAKTILSTLIDRDKELIRNQLSAKIAPLIDRVFGEIFLEEKDDDLDFIQKCFVENKETKKNRDEIERLFADKAPELANVSRAVNTESIKQQISEELNLDNINIRNLVPPKPIIIVGSKGAGKTTFINHLFKYKISPEEIKNHLTIYLDLRKFFNKETFFEPNKVAKEILEGLYEKYTDLELHSLKVLKRIYHKEIKWNDESIWIFDKENDPNSYNKSLSNFLSESQNNYTQHLEKLSLYLIRERRKRLIVIVDNADQFDSKIQEQVFIFAHSLAKTAFCGSVISLREGYYYKWRFSPPFDAYESNVYHITAPKYSEVLQKRIDFALEKISLNGTTRGVENGYKVEIQNQSVIEFLSGLRNSLFSIKNTELIDYLNRTTYPNIREGLSIFKHYLTSGHTNVAEHVLRERFRTTENGGQVIPIHEFVKSIALHNKLYFNSDISVIHNLFIPPLDSNDHFLKMYILKDLYDTLEKNGVSGKFISSKVTIEKFVSLGYRLNIVLASLSELLKLNLIDTEDTLTDIEWITLPSEFNISISMKGHYYYSELCGRFHYLDLTVQDSPIFDIDAFNDLKASFPTSDESGKRSLNLRALTVKKFIEYLKVEEQKQSSQVKAVYGLMTDHLNSIIGNDLNRIEKNTVSLTS
jgi:GTPase SAR1 family protein